MQIDEMQTYSHHFFLYLLTKETGKLNSWPLTLLAAVNHLKAMKHKQKPLEGTGLPHFLNKKTKAHQEKALAVTLGLFSLLPTGMKK